MITLKIGNVHTEIVGGLDEAHFLQLRDEMSFRVQGYQFTPQYNKFVDQELDPKTGKLVGGRRLWDGFKRLCWRDTKRTYFPTGLYSIAIEYLKKHNIPYQNLDCRKHTTSGSSIVLSPFVEERDYQVKAADIMCNAGRGILQAATGAGKTCIAARVINQLNKMPSVVLVTSIDLLEQTKDAMESYLLQHGKSIKIGQVGGGCVDIQDITVMTVQTAVRALGKVWDSKTKFDNDDTNDNTSIQNRKKEIVDLIREAKVVICDEVQHWKANTCQFVVKNMQSAFHNFGISATPYRDAGDDLTIQGCFGKKLHTITASYLIRRGFLVKPRIKILNLDTELSNFRGWQSIYKDKVVECEYYNSIISNIANAYIEKKRLVLTLVQQKNHGRLLEKLIDGAKFLSGDSPKRTRKEYLDKLRNKDISCIISTVIFDEGIDCRPLDTLILAGQGKSPVRAMQRIGRILRTFPEKEQATAIDFLLDQQYLHEHGKAREKMYRTEPEFDIEHLHISK